MLLTKVSAVVVGLLNIALTTASPLKASSGIVVTPDSDGLQDIVRKFITQLV